MPTTTIQIIIIQPLIWAILGLEYPHGTGWGADDRTRSEIDIKAPLGPLTVRGLFFFNSCSRSRKSIFLVGAWWLQ